MSILSARYATPTIVVLALALVPTVVNVYVGRKVVEGPPLIEALPSVLAGQTSQPTTRKATTIRREFASDDWVERVYAKGIGPGVKVLAVRSYDMKRLYHHPELAISEANYGTAEVHEVPAAEGPLAVHVLHGEKGGTAAYALLYKGSTIANPYFFQLRVAPELLLLGQRPLTLVFAEDPSADTSLSANQSPVVRTLVEAMASLRSR
jgi:hypothetical protein